MKVMKKLDKIVDIITRSFAYVAAIALLFIVAIIIANVVMRYVGSAIVGTEEMTSLAQVVVIFLALGYTQHMGGLVHVAFFMKKLPKLTPVIAWALHAWVGTAMVTLLTWQTIVRIPMVKQFSTALLIPFKPFYVVVAIGCAIYLIAQLYVAVKSTVAIFNPEVRQDVVDNLPA